MKKFLFSVYGIILMMLPLVITSCSEDDEKVDSSNLVGEWWLAKEEVNDEEGLNEYEFDEKDHEMDLSITSEKDGLLKLRFYGDSYFYNLEGNKLIPEAEQFSDWEENIEELIDEFTFTVKKATGSELVLYQEDVEDGFKFSITLTFKKK